MKRIHIMLNVKDLKSSKHFYAALLGATPTREKEDYVQWILDEPAVNLSMKSDPLKPWGTEHFGIEFVEASGLEDMKKRITRENLPLKSEEDIICCYARSSKAWLEDPDQMNWELFHNFNAHASYYEFASLVK